jgi:Phytanoyl-CoA dioxygenase (PhyH)
MNPSFNLALQHREKIMRSISEFETGFSASEISAALHEHGFCIVRQAKSPELIRALGHELDSWYEDMPKASGPFLGRNTVRFQGLLNKSVIMRDLVLDPVINGMCDSLLGPACDWFQLNVTQGISIHPGAGQQPPHRDQLQWHGAGLAQLLQINCMWMVDAFTAENGATMLWPGSHKTDPNAWLPEGEAIAATGEPGDALFWLGTTMHGGGSNRTDKPRRGALMGYCLGWLKTFENMFLTYPPEVARHFTPALQELIGYRMHKPNLGSWEGQSPAVMLAPDFDPTVRRAVTDYLRPEQVAMLATIDARLGASQ